MLNVLVVGDDVDLCKTYAEALKSAGHDVKTVVPSTQVITHLVRPEKVPGVIVLEMQVPCGSGMIVLGLVRRLPHLVQTRVLVVSRRPGLVRRASEFWGADLFLREPLAQGELRDAVRSLSRSAPAPDTPAHRKPRLGRTRVWWDKTEVTFIRWTDQGLVFAWSVTPEATVRVPRGAVACLLQNGVLRVEGHTPGWLAAPEPQVETRLQPPEYRRPTSSGRPTPAARLDVVKPEQMAPANSRLQPQEQSSDTEMRRVKQRSDRFTAVVRLIRKLTGGEAAEQAQVSG
jgi:CheY-like chemotaxis protein